MDGHWSKTGTYQELADQLSKLIPHEGSVKNPRKNKALETFRKAANCYYDLNNNGLFNRAYEFKRVFKINPSNYRHPHRRYEYNQELYSIVEQKMDYFVVMAAIEQRLIPENFEVL